MTSWPRAIILLATLLGVIGPHAMAQPDQPNIVIILVDDAALMDFGSYGGEARTPNIDALAARGAMFTQYRTSPLCSPSRAMLLTGLDNHRTGIATIPEVLPEEHVGQPGYTMALEPGVITIADRLRTVGYRTLMSGKWHMGSGEGDLPSHHGFDRSVALDASGADNWEDKAYIPFYADAPWYENGEPIDLPDDFYSSRFIIDKMISYLETSDPAKPFLAYLPFQAIHIPVQTPPEFTAHYDGVYDTGWHELRKARHVKAQSLGLIPNGAPLAPMPENARNWAELTPETRALYTARMQVNAGMMEAMDHHVGRFITYLKTSGAFENTVFVVASDNGPEPSRGDEDPRLKFWMRLNGYHLNLDGMGEQGSWGFIGPEWANAAASPGALYKFYASEGGLRAPLIIAGPGITTQRVTSPAMVTDITPTLLDLISYDETHTGAKPMTGRSLLPVLAGEQASAYAPDDIRAIEVSGNSALYQGDFKITRNIAPVGDGQWRLYNLATDPGETQDLASTEPRRMDQMLDTYAQYSADMGVLDMPAGYDSATQISKNVQKILQKRYGAALLLIALLALLLLLAALHFARRLFVNSRQPERPS